MTGTTVHIPTLATGRLTLRAPCAGDVDACAAFLLDARSVHLGGPTEEVEDGHHYFAELAGSWVLRGYGPFVIDRDGQGIGTVGAWYPTTFDEPELAWTLWDGADEGQGFAYEAATAARDWARQSLGLSSLVSYVSASNHRSVALAKRLGARLVEGPQDRTDPDDLTFRHWGSA